MRTQSSCFTRLTSRVLLLSLAWTVALATSLANVAFAQESDSPDIRGWSLRIERALAEGRSEEALREIDATIAKMPQQAQLYLVRGSLRFRSGKVEPSLADFDKVIELDPQIKPYLWQRGIALYYAGKYQEGLDQFVVHREVNPNDVENAFWHFLCAVKLNGLEAAQKDVLLSGRDTRVPMMQVQDMIQGKATPEDVIAAAERKRKLIQGTDYDRFYGYLYVGLYYDALGRTEDAKLWIDKCVAEKVSGYMGDVAKVHQAMLASGDPKPAPASSK